MSDGNHLSLMEMMESIDGSKKNNKSIDQSKVSKMVGVPRNHVNNFLKGDDLMQKYNEIDQELLMNYDNQTVKVSFD